MEELISPQALRAELLTEEAPTVLDVRDAEAYRQGHIPGALLIPADELAGSLDRIPQGRPVVTY